MSLGFVSSVMFFDPIRNPPFLQPGRHITCVPVSNVQRFFASKLRLLNLICIQRISGTGRPIWDFIGYGVCK